MKTGNCPATVKGAKTLKTVISEKLRVKESKKLLTPNFELLTVLKATGLLKAREGRLVGSPKSGDSEHLKTFNVPSREGGG